MIVTRACGFAVVSLLVGCSACASSSQHGTTVMGRPELCHGPTMASLVSSQQTPGTPAVKGPISNVGVSLGPVSAGSTVTSVRIDIVADPPIGSVAPNPSTNIGKPIGTNQEAVATGSETGVVARKIFTRPTVGQQLLVPFNGSTSAITGTALAAGTYTAWSVVSLTCSLDTGSPQQKSFISPVAFITVP